MRKKAALVCILILFATKGFAQIKIDNVVFERWIDYANCRYTAAYIETLRNDPKEQENIKKFDNQIKSKIQKCTYENPVPFKDLSELLKKNGWEATEKKISAKINEKKQKFQGNEIDADTVIDLLKLDGQLATKLQSAANDLIKEFKEKYKSETLVQDPGPEIEPKSEPPIVNPPKEDSHFWLWLALIANWLILILWLSLFRKKREKPKDTDREIIITTVLGSQRIANQFISRENYSTLQSIKQLEEKIESLRMHINNLQGKKKNNDENKIFTEEEVSIAKTVTDNSKYFKSKNGKVLVEELTRSEGASFKVFNITGNEANFNYCGGVVNQDFFTDVCSFANNPSDVPNKTKIITIEPGVVKKDSNNKWEVTGKAIIKFM